MSKKKKKFALLGKMDIGNKVEEVLLAGSAGYLMELLYEKGESDGGRKARGRTLT